MSTPPPAPLYLDVADAPLTGCAVWLRAADGVRLRAAWWPAVGGGTGRGVVMLFPGRTEVIEKYGRVVADLVAAGFAVSVIDWRGQGLSDRLTPDPLLGYVHDFSDFQDDLEVWVQAVDRWADTQLPRFVLAHSMGGCIALRALIRGFPARSVAAVAFSAPMWGLRAGAMMRAAMVALARAARLAGRDKRAVPGAGIEFRLWENPFENNELTTDAATYSWMQAQLHAHPALRLGPPSLRWLGAALAETAALARLPCPEVPAWCGLGTRERLVDTGAIMARMANWPDARLDLFEGAEHELMMEAPVLRRRFLSAVLARFGDV